MIALAVTAAVAAQQIAIGGYPLPTAMSQPQGIAVGPDGALWFTESYGNKIGRITTTGAVTEYPVLTAGSKPWAITAGYGALWFTELTANQIGCITLEGVITEYPIPTANSAPEGIAAGPDGALWFTEWNTNSIGRITLDGIITEYAVPSPGAGIVWIAAGPDGALWFPEYYANNVGRITTGGVVKEFPVPSPHSGPLGITAGPDRAMWFTEDLASAIGRISTAGTVTEYPLPAQNAGYGPPVAIAPGPDGALWFTEGNQTSGFIGRLSTAGAFEDYQVPNPVKAPYINDDLPAIAAGPDGALWFTELFANRIGQAVFATADLKVSPASGSYQVNLTFTGAGFAPNETIRIYTSGIGSAVLATATADATGSFSVTARAPESPNGPRLFLGSGQTSGKSGAADFYVKPRLIMNPNPVSPGSELRIEGYGFNPFDPVQIYWNNVPGIALAFSTADANGSFSARTAASFRVPTWMPSGHHVLIGIGAAGEPGVGIFIVE